MKTIYLDCTETYRSAHNTGIQRVVRNIVNESVQLTLRADVECRAVIRHRGCYRVIERIANPAAKPAKQRFCDQNWYRSAASALCSLVPSRSLRKWIMPEHGHSGAFNLPHSIARRLRRLTLRFLPEAIPRAGDCLITLDLGLKRDWQEADRLRQAGVALGGVIYDLEPIYHPEFFSRRMVQRFEKWIKAAAHHNDFMLAISATVRQQLLDYLHEQRLFTRLTPERIGPFRLGSNLDGIDPSAATAQHVRAELVSDLGEGHPPTFLTVGTIEPRKNHSLLLDAMEQAWAAGADLRCCIVGVIGWKCEQLVERIQSHAELGKRLLVYHDLTDPELQYVYLQSQAFVYPTHAEGFGLPLVEAMHMGLPVLASDLPILRETSAGQATFFRNDQPAELARLLVRLARGETSLCVPTAEDAPVITWNESAKQFIEHAITMSGIRPRIVENPQRKAA